MDPYVLAWIGTLAAHKSLGRNSKSLYSVANARLRKDVHVMVIVQM